MKTLAVLTGDIIASRNISERDKLVLTLNNTFRDIEKKISKSTQTFEIFRGDSFQGVIKDPEKALLVSILIRARLKSTRFSISSETTKDSKQVRSDARIGIGIGKVSYKGKKIVESDGEAFIYSGELLDKMKKNNSRLLVYTPWEDVNDELIVSLKMLDSLIDNWTSASAEISYLYLLENHTQQDLADRLQISQPAVHKRLSLANLDTIKLMLGRFEKLITTYNK